MVGSFWRRFLELLMSSWQSFNVPWLIQHLCLLAHMSPLCVQVDARCYLSLPQHDCISIPSVEIQFPNKGILWTIKFRASKYEFCGGYIWMSLLESWQKHFTAREATLFHTNLLHQQISLSHWFQGSDFGGHFACSTYPPSWKLLKWEHLSCFHWAWQGPGQHPAPQPRSVRARMEPEGKEKSASVLSLLKILQVFEVVSHTRIAWN